MSPTQANMTSQGEHCIVLSVHMVHSLSVEINEQWMEIHNITLNRYQGSMYGLTHVSF